METEKLACQSAARSREAQVAQNFRLRGMIHVERLQSNILQVEVLRIGAENLQLSQHLDMSKEEVDHLQARCN